MRPVFITADNIVSPLGRTTNENFSSLKSGVSGIQLHNRNISPDPFYASLFQEEQFLSDLQTTRFEKLLLASVKEVLSHSKQKYTGENTVLIISTTKGNISLLEESPFDEQIKERITLHHSAGLVADHLGFKSKPIVVSHACISGLIALITGMRLLQAGKYDHAVIVGADLITRFVLSGFQSFRAISDTPCKPFDAHRNGITLGEAAAAIILSTQQPDSADPVIISGGAVSNDANHISGPSRTGQELHQAIEGALQEASLDRSAIDFISAHGTATMYNDEMESKAITLSGLQQVPVNSLKGYYGHTLGAAGLIETVASVQSLRENVILPTPGFKVPGTTQPININDTLRTGFYKNCLKTASGFGGCNAAIVIQKAG